MILVTARLNGITQIINGQGQHITGNIAQEAGAINSFEFDILPNNAGYDLIKSRKTIIRAVNTITGRNEFAGRVLLPESNMDSNGIVFKRVTCESFLGYLYDSTQPYMEETTMPLNDFIDIVLNNHNAQVEDYKKIYRGKVDVEVAETGNVTKGLQYENSFQTLKSKLVDIFGGELEIQEIDGVLYLNYLKQIGVTRSTTIKLGKNMQSASRKESPLDIITRVIPLGAKIKRNVTDGDGNTTEEETEERLTLVGYTPPGGEEIKVPWIDDTEKINAFGIVCGTLDFSDVTEQSNLYTKTIDFLKNDNLVELTHTLTALDLKEIGQDIDSLNCCDSYPVENTLIGLNEVLRITKKNIDISSPYKSSITIGEKQVTLSHLQATEIERVNVKLNTLAAVVQSLGNSSSEISTQLTTLTTSLTQTVNSIVSEALKTYISVSDMETIKKEISTSVTQTAEGIKVLFNNSLETVTEDIYGNISSEFTELKSYIRYYMNDQGSPVIELGALNSRVICKLMNNRLSFLENGIEVAYISDNQLFITNATILTQLNIGEFAFKPRENGNLSFI